MVKIPGLSNAITKVKNIRLRTTHVVSKAASLSLILTLSSVAFIVSPAHAAGSDIGICATNWSDNYCWRQVSGGATDIWSRDISGDINQQYTAVYIGTASSYDCIPGPNWSNWSNYGVYEFISSGSSGYYVGAADHGYMGVQAGSPNYYDQWVWAPNGVLYNCGASVNAGVPEGITNQAKDYNQLYVTSNNTWATWAQVHGS